MIVTDTMMPVLDGPGLLAALTAEPAYRDVPVILMSALAEVAVAKLTQGYRAFLQKPFLSPELLRILERVLLEVAKGPPSHGADPVE